MSMDNGRLCPQAIKLQLAIDRFAQSYPFHAAVLACFHITEDTDIDTMAVSFDGLRFRLHWSPDFVSATAPDALPEVIHHEVNHVIFGHLGLDQKLFPCRAAFIIAAELCANEGVRADLLPGEPWLLDDYPDFPPWESIDRRYWRLEKLSGLPQMAQAAPGSHALWPGEQDMDAAGQARQDILDLAALLCPPDALANLDPATQSARREAARHEDAASQPYQPGKGSASLELSLSWRPGHIPWQRILERHHGVFLDTEFRLSRPPRRGDAFAGLSPSRGRYRDSHRVLGIIDTSGSLRPSILEEINGELARIARLSELRIVECDCRIQRCYPWPQSGIRTVMGRGGTSFLPPFEIDFLRKQAPSLIIYFTDGEGTAPRFPPPIPVIWVITPGGRKPAPWGLEMWMKK